MNNQTVFDQYNKFTQTLPLPTFTIEPRTTTTLYFSAPIPLDSIAMVNPTTELPEHIVLGGCFVTRQERTPDARQGYSRIGLVVGNLSEERITVDSATSVRLSATWETQTQAQSAHLN